MICILFLVYSMYIWYIWYAHQPTVYNRLIHGINKEFWEDVVFEAFGKIT